MIQMTNVTVSDTEVSFVGAQKCMSFESGLQSSSIIVSAADQSRPGSA